MNENFYEYLIKRVSHDHLRKRLIRQVDLAAKFYAQGGYTAIHLENLEFVFTGLKYILKFLGLLQRGIANSLDYKIEHQPVFIKHLPQTFHGFKIVQLSDIHANAIFDGGKILREKLLSIQADLCVITGDYRFLTQDAYEEAVNKTIHILKPLKLTHGIWGVLGNHDFIEFVPILEKAGIHMLLNESVSIPKDNEHIYIAGIDDAHFYDCHDIYKATSQIPSTGVSILLSHTPETYAEACLAGIDYLLCGHTHGGQICLPGGFPLLLNAKCPRKFCKGFWYYQKMSGYTSRGTGSSGLPVRFNSRPEITVHELRCPSIE